MEILIIIIIAYTIIVFGLSYLVIPHLGWKQEPILEKISDNLQEKINELKTKAKNKREFLDLAYDYLGGRYRSERFNTVLKFHYMFKNLDDIWSRQGFIPCNQSNFLMRIFLVKSGFFREDEIRKRHCFLNFVPHQYLQIKIDNKWVDVDVGEKYRGMLIGKHLKYFG